MSKGTPLPGDRAAWNDVDNADYHAKDIADDSLNHHLVDFTTGEAGYALVWNGTAWTLRALQHVVTAFWRGTVSATPGVMRIPNTFGVDLKITKVRLDANTPPATDPLIADVHEDGTTIFTNQAHRPQIAVSAYTGESTTIDDSTWHAGSYLTIDIDQAGGADVTATITAKEV